MLLGSRGSRYQTTDNSGAAAATERGQTITMGGLRWVNNRLGSTRFITRSLNKVFPDHWSFLTGEICLYSFIILLITGVYLTLFFRPSGQEVIYHGRYTPLRGLPMSQAYASMLHLSFDVRAGLLIRQIHAWTTLVFFAAIVIHVMRVFFTGAFRQPRKLNWVIGTAVLAIALIEGWSGYSLPDDLLSGTGLHVTYGVLQSIPLVGSYVVYFIFGGGFPGSDTFIPRLFVMHVLLIPGIIIVLAAAHIALVWVQKHTDFRGPKRTEHNVIGSPLWPRHAGKSLGLFLAVAAFVSILGGLAQIDPIWLYGPSSPAQASAGSQPDWYMGWIDGAIRLMPGWELNLWGHTLVLSVFLPALVLPGALLTSLAVYPWIEQWVTRDEAPHELLDRPRERPKRTALGVAILTLCALLLLAGANDVIAVQFHVALYAVTWSLRVLVVVGPLIAFDVTRRLALGLQARDQSRLSHGHETGRISRDADGGYHESTIAISTDERARIQRDGHLRDTPVHLGPATIPLNNAAQERTIVDGRGDRRAALLWRVIFAALTEAHAHQTNRQR